jgi:hypothetical protein
MIHPDIQHLYSDNFWMYIGKYINNIHYLDDVIIEHEHYCCGKSFQDDMYKELNSNELFTQDNNAYNNIINSEELHSKLKQIQNNKLELI